MPHWHPEYERAAELPGNRSRHGIFPQAIKTFDTHGALRFDLPSSLCGKGGAKGYDIAAAQIHLCNGFDDVQRPIIDVKTEKACRNEPGKVFQAILHCLSDVQAATYS
jgi:hypothetical protein